MRLKILAVTAILVVFGSYNIPASELKEVVKCATLENPIKRLECFDTLATGLGANTPSRTTSKIGRWTMKKETSKIDDSLNISLSLSADSDISGWPAKNSRPTLILRCKEKNIDAYIATGMTPAVEYDLHNKATATLRFDKDKAFSEVMDESTDNNALFFENPVGIIAKLLTHGVMLFQFTPFNSSPVMATFSLSGLKKAILPLTAACGSSALDAETKKIRFKSLVAGTPIKLTLKNGQIISGIFASYDEEFQGEDATLSMRIMDSAGKENAFKNYKNNDILSMNIEDNNKTLKGSSTGATPKPQPKDTPPPKQKTP